MAALNNIKTIAAIDYVYDANGNLKKDLNKDIGTATAEGIIYNHLNLPWKITVAGKGTIEYVYDATGSKLQKKVMENNQPVKTTDYIAGTVYEKDALQFMGHEEGRMRLAAQPTIVNACGSTGSSQWLAFDYCIKDHLGNIRMTLTDEWQKEDYPAATMETASTATENALYSKVNGSRETNLPPGYPATANPGFQPNAAVARLNAQSNPTGPGILLKVMAGDRINLRCDVWYRVNSGQGITNNGSALARILLQLATSVPGVSGGHLTQGQTGTNGSFFNGAVTEFFTQQPAVVDKPKAYVNWLLMDEQFKMAGGSGAEPVGGNEEYKQFVKVCNDAVEVQKNGYIYVYTSNESNIDVFFDNLQVSLVHGPLVEETHYYPFGLTMSGISSKAAGKLENKQLFNKGSELQNKEFGDGSGIELYATPLRSLDPQLGRWWQIDSKPDHAQSPYTSMDNNPILKNDPLGDIAWETKNYLFIPGTSAVIPVTTIHVTGVVRDMTNAKNLTPEQLKIAAQRINDGIKTAYTGISKDGIVIADPQITSGRGLMGPLPIKKDDHVFSLYGDGNLPNPTKPFTTFPKGTTSGAALPGQKGIALLADLLNYSPATEGKNAGTGLSADDNNTLERTSSHELGHTLLGAGHSDLPRNLMQQSIGTNPGMKLTKDQFNTIHQNINNSNGPIQFYP